MRSELITKAFLAGAWAWGRAVIVILKLYSYFSMCMLTDSEMYFSQERFESS